jgi:hypothetical protein
MLHHLLTIQVLREVARRYGLPSTGTKDQLIHRLQEHENMATQQQVDNLQLQLTALQAQLQAQQAPQPSPPTPAATWLLFEPARLASFLEVLGMQRQDGMTHQTMADALATVPGLTPHRAQTTLDAANTRARPKVDMQLAKQTATERVDAFLARAKTHFQLVRASDAEATTMLVNAALPPIAAYIAENVATGVLTIEAHLRHIEQRFAPTRFQLYEQFARYRMTPRQTAHEVGNDLRRLLLGYLQLPDADIPGQTPTINLMLIARLIDVLPCPAANQLRTELLRHPGTTWDMVQDMADQICQGTNGGGQASNTNQQQKHCSIHGYAGHSNADCRQQQRDKPQSPAPIGQRRQAGCFTCGKPGHIAVDCPTASQLQPGNR